MFETSKHVPKSEMRCVLEKIYNQYLLISDKLYYINTSEIPSELSCKNFISSHVKITWYLHTWRYHEHHCFSYIISEKVPRCLAVWSKHWFFLNNLRQSSEIFGNPRKYLVIFGKCSENVQKRSSGLRTNLGKSSEISGKWSEIFGK